MDTTTTATPYRIHDARWCYRCNCPKSVCGADAGYKSPVFAKMESTTGRDPSVIFVGGPLDGQRRSLIAQPDDYSVALATDFPAAATTAAATNFPAAATTAAATNYRVGTYKRTVLGAGTERHVAYVWAGEKKTVPAVGDRIRWARADYKVVASDQYAVQAVALGEPEGEYMKMTVGSSVLTWNAFRERWDIKSGSVITMVGRRVAA